MPFGKNWRSKPLVFSLLPRCHGTRGYVATLGGVTFLDLTHSTVSMAISVPNLGPTDVALETPEK